MKVPHASGAVVVCGKCSVSLELHPVKNCPYEYKPIKWRGRVVGYNMVRKK